MFATEAPAPPLTVGVRVENGMGEATSILCLVNIFMMNMHYFSIHFKIRLNSGCPHDEGMWLVEHVQMRTARKEGQEKGPRSLTLRGEDPDESGSRRVREVVCISRVQIRGQGSCVLKAAFSHMSKHVASQKGLPRG